MGIIYSSKNHQKRKPVFVMLLLDEASLGESERSSWICKGDEKGSGENLNFQSNYITRLSGLEGVVGGCWSRVGSSGRWQARGAGVLVGPAESQRWRIWTSLPCCFLTSLTFRALMDPYMDCAAIAVWMDVCGGERVCESPLLLFLPKLTFLSPSLPLSLSLSVCLSVLLFSIWESFAAPYESSYHWLSGLLERNFCFTFLNMMGLFLPATKENTQREVYPWM